MEIRIGPPTRHCTLQGPMTVNSLLSELGLDRESHLVVRNGTLVTGDVRLSDADSIEIRRVISGGAL
jgi:sulfur carrier protein ThiS